MSIEDLMPWSLIKSKTNEILKAIRVSHHKDYADVYNQEDTHEQTKQNVGGPSISNNHNEHYQQCQDSSFVNDDCTFENKDTTIVMEVTYDENKITDHASDDLVVQTVEDEPSLNVSENIIDDTHVTAVTGVCEENIPCQFIKVGTSAELMDDPIIHLDNQGNIGLTHSKNMWTNNLTVKDFSSGSSGSTSISEGTNEEIEAILDQPCQPITATPLQTATQEQVPGDLFLLQDNHLPTTISCKEIILHDSSKTPIKCNMMPLRFCQSSFLPNFSSSDKRKEKMAYKYRQKFPFDEYEICYDPPLDLIDEFDTWIKKELLRNHSKKKLYEDHYKSRCSSFGPLKIDLVIACPKDKNWFYRMS